MDDEELKLMLFQFIDFGGSIRNKNNGDRIRYCFGTTIYESPEFHKKNKQVVFL